MTSASERNQVYLVDGSSYIFRAFHALPPMTRSDGTPVNAVYGFTNMLTKLVEDTGAEYMAVLFDSARKTFRNEVYSEYKAHRPPAAGRSHPPVRADPGGDRRLQLAEPGNGGIRSGRSDRHSRPHGGRAGIRGHHRFVRQGPHAARRRGRPHAGSDEEPCRRTAGGLRKVRGGSRQGDRCAGAGRRFHGQRARRAGNRSQDRGAAHRGVRRPRYVARSRGGDQAAQAAPGSGRKRGTGADLARVGHVAQRRFPSPAGSRTSG